MEGNPRYISKLVEIEILEDVEILHATSLSTSTKKAMLDLGRLIFCPEAEQKVFKHSIIVSI